MQQRHLGRQGLVSSAIGYGAMGINMAYGPSDEERSVAAIHRALDLGVTMFDTAEIYGWGENEKLLGRALRDRRDDVVIATKFGWTREMGFDSRPEHIRDVIDASLTRLGVDHIDVLYQHRVDPAVPIEDVAGEVQRAIQAGKVKYFGLSEAGSETLRRAHAVQPVSVLQTEYSLFAREVERLFPTLDELGIGLVAYSPIARGFLSDAVQPGGTYADGDVRLGEYYPWWHEANYARNVEIVDSLRSIAAGKGIAVSQLALAWILAQRADIVPIPGSRNPERVESNAASAAVSLSERDLTAIADAVGDGPYGERSIMQTEWV